MKKSLFILAAFFLMLFLPSQAQAVELVMDGQSIQSDVPPTIVSGRTLVPLRVISEKLEAQVTWQANSRTVLIDKGDIHIRLPIGKNEALKNGQKVALDVPPRIIKDRTMVPIRFIAEIFGNTVRYDASTQKVIITTGSVNSPPPERVPPVSRGGQAGRPTYRVMIDPGHGGRDPGAIGPSRTLEKDVVMAIALKVKDKLEQDNIQVAMVRSDDTFVSLQGRADQSANTNPDLFLSIHANSAPSRAAHGVETYYRYGAYRGAAQTIQKAFQASTGLTNRGIKQERLWVLKPESVPSVLVETAFISNPEEEKLLSSEDYQEKAAQGIANGIEAYLKQR